MRLLSVERECSRLHDQADKHIQEIRALEQKLNQARNLLSEENLRARKSEQEKEIITKKFDQMRELLLGDHGTTLNNETKQKLQRLEASVTSLRNAQRGSRHILSPALGGGVDLSVVNEIDSTGSILDVSDLSFDATCDPSMANGLDESRTRSGRQYKRKSEGNQKRRSKRSRGSHGLVLENRISVDNQGNVMGEAVLATRKSLEKIAARRSMRKSQQHHYNERNIDDYLPQQQQQQQRQQQQHDYLPSAPPNDEYNNAQTCWNNVHQSSPQVSNLPSEVFTPKTPSVQRSHSNAGINARRHIFEPKKVFKNELCGPCGMKLKWGKTAYKCLDCRASAHAECKEKVPLPCVGVGMVKTTPGRAAVAHVLADFTPAQAPMVPALVVHCVNEIEKRGLYECGIYRVPGSEREVKDLKDKFLRGKGCPNLSKIDVHVLCGCLKDFLRNLREQLIPQSMWAEFTQACSNPDETDGESGLFQAISKLPQPNRDTLAFLILHFKRVGEVLENKMTINNLSKILGPTIIGYSSPNPSPEDIISELSHMQICVEKMLEVDSDYWRGYVELEGDSLYPRMDILSPGTPEIFQPLIRDTGLTPSRGSSVRARSVRLRETEKNFFNSPMLV